MKILDRKLGMTEKKNVRVLDGADDADGKIN